MAVELMSPVTQSEVYVTEAECKGLYAVAVTSLLHDWNIWGYFCLDVQGAIKWKLIII